MNLIKKPYIKFKNNAVRVVREKNSLRIINPTDSHGFILFPKIYSGKKYKSAYINFRGKVINGNGAVLQLLNTSRIILSETPINSSSTYMINSKNLFFTIKINRQSEVVITAADVN